MDKKRFNAFLEHTKVPHDLLGREEIGNFAVMVSVIEIDDDYHFLFQKRAKHIRQGSEISFPGGQYDPELDENFLATAIRETCEELGVTPDQIEVISQLDTFFSHVYIENYLGIIHVDDLEDLRINKDEVAYVFTIPLDYFISHEPETYAIKIRSMASEIDEEGNLIEYIPVKELELPERYQHAWNDSLRDVYVYKTEHGPLWGLTAHIVYDTVKKHLRGDQ